MVAGWGISGIFLKFLNFPNFCNLIGRGIRSDLEAGILVWAPEPCAQKSFLVQYILSIIHSDNRFVIAKGFDELKKGAIVS